MLQLGLMIEGQWGLTWPRWERLLKTAEESGFQCVFRSDHYTIGPPDRESLETWVSLTYAAMQTRRIEFGTLVCPTTFRHPALTARMAAHVDDLSGGRLVLGLGAGWHEREHKQFGIPFYDRQTRYAMLEDALEVTRRLFRSDTPVSYSGKHYPLEEAILLPSPQRAGGPPILIGGNGMKKTLPLVAKYADEWNGVHITPAEYRERNQRLDELVEQAGRKPGQVKRSLMHQVIFGRTDAEVKARLEQSPGGGNRIIGTPQAIVDQLGAYAEAGVQRAMLMWLDLADIHGIEQLASEVLPHFR
jgi:F420-dependent oxidoreductase-like protein